jgi:hypothetical protein
MCLKIYYFKHFILKVIYLEIFTFIPRTNYDEPFLKTNNVLLEVHKIGIVVLDILHTNRYFCDGTLQNGVPEVLSQKDARWNGVPELFPGNDITNISPSPIGFWSLYMFRNLLSLEKKLCSSNMGSDRRIHVSYVLSLLNFAQINFIILRRISWKLSSWVRILLNACIFVLVYSSLFTCHPKIDTM